MNKVFHYNNTDITFQTGNGDVMMNATQMARPFGKRPSKWLELPSTTQFLNELSNVRKSDNWIRTERGQHGGGTWMHEDVALEFARWLSPSFAIWCNDRIKELMKHGVTALNPEDLIDPDFVINAMNQLKAEREQNQRLSMQNEAQAIALQRVAPKVKYHDQVLDTRNGILTNVIAKELGTSAITLNKFLKSKRVIYKQGGTYLLYQRYQNKGLTDTKTFTYVDDQGVMKSQIQTLWTEKGRQLIHRLWNE